jgi:UDP-glucose:(heptosyl)LPS alpha-1,3-glucosyltransferase
VVAGAGAIEEYTQRAEEAGARGRVHFLGAVPDVNRYLAASDAFIFPTRYEAAPLVSYEAAGSGLPLLVTPVNGVEDFLREGVNGWFIGQDAPSIERRLAELEADPELRKSMGEAARSAVLGFKWDAVVEAYLELYAELAAGDLSPVPAGGR